MELRILGGEIDRYPVGGRVPRRGGYHGNKKLRCKCRRVPCSLVSRILPVTASICIGLVKNSGGEINGGGGGETTKHGFRKFHAPSRSRPLLVLDTNRVVIRSTIEDVYKARSFASGFCRIISQKVDVNIVWRDFDEEYLENDNNGKFCF